MPSNHQTVIENYIQAYNQMNIPGMLTDLHADVVFENMSNGVVDLRTEGKDEFEIQAKKAKNLFAQRNQRITNWQIKENVIIIDIDYQATLAIDLPNGLQAGDELELQGQSEFHFQDGKVVKIQDRS